MNILLRSTTTLAALTLLSACPRNPEPNPTPPAGIDEGVFAAELGAPMAKATPEQREIFEEGREVALRRWDTDTGLGPQFNVTFCTACHEQPTAGGSSPRYRDFLLVSTKLEDGSAINGGVNGVQQQFSTTPPHRVDTEESVNHMAGRSAIPFFGVGAIAALNEDAILANVDEDDADGDGISGRANYDRGFVGRFGRKSQTVSIEGFVRGPLFNHLHLTSNPLPNELKAMLPVPSDVDIEEALMRGALLPCINCQAAAPAEPLVDEDAVPDPELSEQDLFKLVSFAMLLGAPQPEPLTEETQKGKELFEQVDCAKCHTESLEGAGGDVPLYSDLLLHDMGDELADGISMGVATGNEFRTHPLWGVVASSPYLHDGRADTLHEAISMHAGEAEKSRDAYLELSDDDQQLIVAFLESLGGKSQTTEGLIPPDQPAPAFGELGGPVHELSDTEAQQFEQGRRAFDRDATEPTGLGLGDGFNGDSCRACHFEPVVGGAGPSGVSVTRQSIVDPTTLVYTAPAEGTMLHHHNTTHIRPQREEDCNVIELRSTPSLLGLGLIDQIPEDAILSREDPDDTDSDGISGRAHRIPDGRIGRFGWKSGIPTLEDFVRDAISNEVGLTLADSAAFVAGIAGDDDDAADPELGGSDYDALVFFTRMLAPAPTAALTDAEARGQAHFEAVGCDDCHTPEMATAGGDPVALYSDLLLHDVAPEGYMGVDDGQATMREFRTPPLWGIGGTAPYMHDGLAPTLDAAIRRHEAESTASREAYEALTDDERDDLISFLGAI